MLSWQTTPLHCKHSHRQLLYIANIHIDNSSTINTNSDHYLISFEHAIHNNHKTTADPNQLQNSPICTRRSQSSIPVHGTTHSLNPTHQRCQWDGEQHETGGISRQQYSYTSSTPQQNHPKWSTPHIKHQLNTLSTLGRPVKKHPTPNKSASLAERESDLQALVKITKDQYEFNFIGLHQSNPVKLWGIGITGQLRLFKNYLSNRQH